MTGEPAPQRHGDARAELRLDSGLSADAFKRAFRSHPSGVAVVSADAGDGPVAFTATSVFSVSAEPALLVFSIADAVSAAGSVTRAETVVVHLLGARDLDLARLCATSGVDRFADPASWSRLVTGEPVFAGVDNWIRGRVIDTLRAGTSTVVVVHALQAGRASTFETAPSLDAEAPLVYHNRTWHRLGEASRMN